MLKDRNDMTHIYDGKAAQRLAYRILDSYIPVFIRMREGIETYYQGELSKI